MILSWRSIEALPRTQLGWESAADINGVDPYAAWADAMAFQGMGKIDIDNGLPLLIEVDRDPGAQDKVAPGQAQYRTGKESAAHGRAKDPSSAPIRTHLEKTYGVRLLETYMNMADGATGRVATLHGLVPLTEVRRIRGRVEVPVPPGGVFKVGLRALMSVPRVTLETANLRSLDVKQEGPCIAIIDDGCPFAHRNVRRLDNNRWTSRIEYLWDQSRGFDPQRDPVQWRAPQDFGYGRELTRDGIEEFINDSVAPGTQEVDEDACYATARYDAVQPRWTHGSVITDLAAGSPSPLAGFGAAADAAEKAHIIFVQLPRGAVEDPSGGALPGFVVDALNYIGARTTLKGEPQPVAINLSYGTFAGPHDGTSPVEVAIDQFLAARPDCTVVVSAGNAYDAQIHAELTIPHNDFKTLHWYIPPGDPTHNFMEIWLPSKDDDGTAPSVAVSLVPPPGWAPASPAADSGKSWFGFPAGDTTGLPVCAVIHPASVPQGTVGTMVLLAVGATDGDPATAPLAPAGTWTVEIRNNGNVDLEEVHAWIERDDPSFQQNKQSRFDDPSLVQLRSACTLGSFSHACEAIVVGACVDDGSSGRPLSKYSSAGPGRLGLARTGPDFAAGADESLTLPGLRAAGTHSADTVRLGGTSVAAAVVTRHAVNEVLSNPTYGGQIGDGLLHDPAPGEGPGRLGKGRIKSLPP